MAKKKKTKKRRQNSQKNKRYNVSTFRRLDQFLTLLDSLELTESQAKILYIKIEQVNSMMFLFSKIL